jgi:hypothetical protein
VLDLGINWLQVDAAGSLAAGDVTYDNVHKAIFGYNQNKNRHLLSPEVKVRQCIFPCLM